MDNTNNTNNMDTPFDVEIAQTESQQQPKQPIRSRTSFLIEKEVRELVAKTVKDDVRSTLSGRTTWRRVSNTFEAVAKGLTAVSSVLAFAASAIDDMKTVDILCFTSGTIGTLGLVLLTYSTYAQREARERTDQVNQILESIGITPVTQLGSVNDTNGEV